MIALASGLWSYARMPHRRPYNSMTYFWSVARQGLHGRPTGFSRLRGPQAGACSRWVMSPIRWTWVGLVLDRPVTVERRGQVRR
jgi:hypothetical protein